MASIVKVSTIFHIISSTNFLLKWIVFYSCEVVIGDLQSEEERDILVDLKVANISNQSTTPVLVTSCELKYFNVISESDVSTNCDLQIEIGISQPCIDIVYNLHFVFHYCNYIIIGQLEAMQNKKVDIQSNRLLVTQALKQAHQLADIGIVNIV